MKVLYHLTLAAELEAGSDAELYRPARFALDGFVHCTADIPTALEVARSYFSDATGTVLLLTLDRGLLHSPVRLEAPAPLPGGGAGHLREGVCFPHVYGPIELRAITSRVTLARTGQGFTLP